MKTLDDKNEILEIRVNWLFERYCNRSLISFIFFITLESLSITRLGTSSDAQRYGKSSGNQLIPLARTATKIGITK